MLSLMSLPATNDNVDTNYASDDFAESYKIAWDKNQLYFAENGLDLLSNYAIANDTEINDVEASTTLITATGRYSGYNITGSSYTNWERNYEAFSNEIGRNISSNLLNLSITIENMTLSAESTVEVSYQGPEKEMSKILTLSSNKNIYDVRDPFLASRGYNSRFKACSFDSPISASFTRSISSYNGTGFGIAAVEPNLPDISNPIERVLVTEDPSSYGNSSTDNFAAVVTNQTTLSGSYNDVYASNVDISTVSDGESLIVHEGEVYSSRFRKAISDGCYFSAPGHPGVEERYANNSQNYAGSVVTFIDETQVGTNQSKSSVGYQYFEGASSPLVEVAGVSYGRGETVSWFRVSEDVATALGFGSITR